MRGTDRSWLAWNAEALDTVVEAALLRYLAVAHFGRGRGDWVGGRAPRALAGRGACAALAPHREALASLWHERAGDDTNAAMLAPLRAELAALCSPRHARPCCASIPMPRRAFETIPEDEARESAQPTGQPAR